MCDTEYCYVIELIILINYYNICLTFFELFENLNKNSVQIKKSTIKINKRNLDKKIFK